MNQFRLFHWHLYPVNDKVAEIAGYISMMDPVANGVMMSSIIVSLPGDDRMS